MVSNKTQFVLQYRDRILVLLTLLNIQELIATNLGVLDTNLHRELELLNKAIVKRKHES